MVSETRCTDSEGCVISASLSAGQVWLITGASGLLGHHLCAYLVERGQSVIGLRGVHPINVESCEDIQCNLRDRGAVRDIILRRRPQFAVHAAGVTSVDDCEREWARAEDLHVHATSEVVLAMREIGGHSTVISTDHLWGGRVAMVAENEIVAPMNVYARTKAAGENATLAADPEALVIRTNFFGGGRPWRRSLSDWLFEELHSSRKVNAFHDVFFTPIAIPLLCELLVKLISDRTKGILHLAGGERISKYQFAIDLAEHFGFDTSLIASASIETANLSAPRPRDMSLNTDKAAKLLGAPLPSLAQSFNSLRTHNQHNFILGA
jgi:dTDP-4-dehydrorhamnose reductase